MICLLDCCYHLVGLLLPVLHMRVRGLITQGFSVTVSYFKNVVLILDVPFMALYVQRDILETLG